MHEYHVLNKRKVCPKNRKTRLWYRSLYQRRLWPQTQNMPREAMKNWPHAPEGQALGGRVALPERWTRGSASPTVESRDVGNRHEGKANTQAHKRERERERGRERERERERGREGERESERDRERERERGKGREININISI
jgi:hypothetical protein